jgi:hypothetical protein
MADDTAKGLHHCRAFQQVGPEVVLEDGCGGVHVGTLAGGGPHRILPVPELVWVRMEVVVD